MSNQKTTALTALAGAALAGDDLIPVVDADATTTKSIRADHMPIFRGTFAGRPAAGQAGRLYVSTDSNVLLVDSGSAWQGYVPGQARMTIPDFSAGWSWDNQDGATITDRTGWHELRKASSSSLSMYYKTAPATPWTFTVCMPHIARANPYPLIGVGFRESSSGKIHVFGWVYDVSNAGLISGTYTNSSTFNAAYLQEVYYRLGQIPTWFRISNDGSLLSCSYSFNGVSFVSYHAAAIGSFLTPDQYGLTIAAPATSGQEVVAAVHSLAVS